MSNLLSAYFHSTLITWHETPITASQSTENINEDRNYTSPSFSSSSVQLPYHLGGRVFLLQQGLLSSLQSWTHSYRSCPHSFFPAYILFLLLYSINITMIHGVRNTQSKLCLLTIESLHIYLSKPHGQILTLQIFAYSSFDRDSVSLHALNSYIDFLSL